MSQHWFMEVVWIPIAVAMSYDIRYVYIICVLHSNERNHLNFRHAFHMKFIDFTPISFTFEVLNIRHSVLYGHPTSPVLPPHPYDSSMTLLWLYYDSHVSLDTCQTLDNYCTSQHLVIVYPVKLFVYCFLLLHLCEEPTWSELYWNSHTQQRFYRTPRIALRLGTFVAGENNSSFLWMDYCSVSIICTCMESDYVIPREMLVSRQCMVLAS